MFIVSCGKVITCFAVPNTLLQLVVTLVLLVRYSVDTIVSCGKVITCFAVPNTLLQLVVTLVLLVRCSVYS